MKRVWQLLLTGSIPVAIPLIAAAQEPSIGVELISDSFDQPVFVTAPPGDDRLFVVDQPGRIWIVEDGRRLDTPFLDISGRVRFRGERGLLGLAFHPDYGTNGRLFVNYSDRAGDTQIVAFEVSDDADRAAPDSARPLLNVDQPAGNHNGGWLGFGPDGYLYIGVGDGGGDRYRNGQNRNTLLGAILRIDVGTDGAYLIPPTNPFANGGGAPEVFVYGLRNPWRAAFDGEDLYIADVGQSAWEEVSVISIDGGGANLGWPVMEGAHCFRASSCDQSVLVRPVHEFSHEGVLARLPGVTSIAARLYRRSLATTSSLTTAPASSVPSDTMAEQRQR